MLWNCRRLCFSRSARILVCIDTHQEQVLWKLADWLSSGEVDWFCNSKIAEENWETSQFMLVYHCFESSLFHSVKNNQKYWDCFWYKTLLMTEKDEYQIPYFSQWCQLLQLVQLTEHDSIREYWKINGKENSMILYLKTSDLFECHWHWLSLRGDSADKRISFYSLN